MRKKALHLVPGPEISTLTSSGMQGCVCVGGGNGATATLSPTSKAPLSLSQGCQVLLPGVARFSTEKYRTLSKISVSG